jgi:uncharacterized DUF497 family protein
LNIFDIIKNRKPENVNNADQRDIMKFEWDEEKNKINIEKHGIDFLDAAQVFNDPLHAEIYDEVHSTEEERWIIIGNIGAIVLVVVTYREEDLVRIISAREATAAERRQYYE